MVEPGVTTLEIDRGGKMIAMPVRCPLQGYHGYPLAICASVNEHGRAWFSFGLRVGGGATSFL